MFKHSLQNIPGDKFEDDRVFWKNSYGLNLRHIMMAFRS